jgi:REP element-mobilizing transposase RayT
LKIDDQPVWYHCYNRIAGTSADLPFGDVEKEKFVRLLHRVNRLYSVKIVAYQVMSNHFHLLVHAPCEQPSEEDACQRYKAFHHGKRELRPGSRECRDWQARCRDVSWLLRHLQHLFTVWYNRTRPIRRRGSLWADRFKHTILESGQAVWSCWSYIENNPVRAGMVADPADYRFCSHGAWHQSGRHPFAANLATCILPMLNKLFGLSTLDEVRARMDQTLAEKADRAVQAAGFTLTIRRRVRYWSSGLVIGSETFLREVMVRHESEGARRHRVAKSTGDATTSLCAWRRLTETG